MNPQTGDTFAWTVDLNNQDQGLWQDKCALNGGVCSNTTITFAQQCNTTALETSTLEGAPTIANGNYNLALSAVPPGRTRSCWPGPTTCGRRPGHGLRLAQHHQFHYLPECPGGRVPARSGLEHLQSAGDLYRQRQRPLALDRRDRRNRSACSATDSTPLPEPQRQPGIPGPGGESWPVIILLHPYWPGRRQRRRGRQRLPPSPRIGRRFSPATAVPRGYRPHQHQQLVRQRPAWGRHLSVLAVRSVHPIRLWHNSCCQRRRCRRRWLRHASARNLPGRPG